MLLLVVICVIVGIWLWKKSENSKKFTENHGTDKNEDSSDNNVIEVKQKETIVKDNAQQVDHSYDVDEILNLKNKDFVFKCLYILREKNRKEDIDRLTDVDFCKTRFNMYYAILQEVNFDINDEKIFMDNCGYRRYYPDIVTLFNKKYIVCNDWFYNNKTNTRDTRTPFVRWVVR